MKFRNIVFVRAPLCSKIINLIESRKFSDFQEVPDDNYDLPYHQNDANGDTVMIKMDVPGREEPSFPKEKWKTFIGEFIFLFWLRIFTWQRGVNYGVSITRNSEQEQLHWFSVFFSSFLFRFIFCRCHWCHKHH